MDTKIVFLMVVIIVLWVLVNPKSRDWIKATTSNTFGAAK